MTEEPEEKLTPFWKVGVNASRLLRSLGRDAKWLAAASGLSDSTVRRALAGRVIRTASQVGIAYALGLPAHPILFKAGLELTKDIRKTAIARDLERRGIAWWKTPLRWWRERKEWK